MKSEIVKLRKKIFKNLKARALSYEVENLELNSYLADQGKLSKRKFNITDIDQLNKSVLDSSIVYLGDFHTFDQNIRNVLRIVKYLISEKTSCILALEMVSKENQLYIDAYLDHHLTDLEFLECINYHTSWRFPWSHYKLIFELAKKHKIKIVALNKEGSLSERDEFAAELLAEIHEENPDASLLVLYGELHITKNKIPAIMEKKCPHLISTIIHQNLDEVYWKLIKDDLEQGIVSFSKNEYCIISAPPWIKYESMVYWYENLSDDPDFDIHEYIIETGAKIFIDDTKENFLHMCTDLIKHLDLRLEASDLEDFNLYDHTNLEYVEEVLENKLKPSLLSFYTYLISTSRSFRFPTGNTYYCSSYSMNRISYLAGIHICQYYFQKNKIDTRDILNSKSLNQKFILFCYEAMFAYFFSKIINPHRKCDMYVDLAQKDTPETKLAISILDAQDITKVIRGSKITKLYESSLYVGHILGEYLYLNYSKETNSIKLEKEFLKSDIEKLDFQKIKSTLLKGSSYQLHNKRYF